MALTWRLVLTLSLAANIFAAQKIDAKADDLLKRVSAHIASAKTAEVELRLGIKIPAPEGARDMAANYSLSIERPNKMALLLKDEGAGATVVSDGTNSITYIPKPRIYTIQKAPPKIGAIEQAGPTGDMGSMAFILALFSDDPRAALLAGVLEATETGREKVGEVECARIDLKQEGLSWRLFIAGDEKPLVRRIEVTIPQLELSIDFTNWTLNAAIPPDRFKFTPPEGAKKVDNLLDDAERDGEESELIGGEIPALKLKAIDGGQFDSASFRKKTSILVIWAGEAEHCLSAIRAASELAAQNKGVIVQTINIDEKPDKERIKSLLAKHKLSVKTALDQNGEAIENLDLDGVPMTFLIDKEGVIRKAFLGYHSDFKTVVGKELDALQKESK